MKTITKTLLATSLCMFMAVPAHAGRHHDDDRLVDRMERQHQRIVSGLESGALTRKEGKVLKKQKLKTHSMARIFNEDGALSKKERLIINRQLNKRSERIWNFKHNDNDRHTDRCALRDTHRDASWHNRHHRHHRHHQRDRHHEYEGRAVKWFSDDKARPRYGFLFR